MLILGYRVSIILASLQVLLLDNIIRVEEKMKQLEEKINDLVEQSVLAGCKNDTKKALDLAKEAANKERSLIRLKEQAGANEGHDWDITFSV